VKKTPYVKEDVVVKRKPVSEPMAVSRETTFEMINPSVYKL
jgi:hypothetical protein